MSNKDISHQGIVEEVCNNVIKIKITQHSACALCHQHQSCSLSNNQEKIIDAVCHDQTLKKGDTVTVFFSKKLGKKAVLLGYVYPFLLILLTLVVSTHFFSQEIIAGLMSLCILIFYYVLLYIFRDHIKNEFIFKVGKHITP